MPWGFPFALLFPYVYLNGARGCNHTVLAGWGLWCCKQPGLVTADTALGWPGKWQQEWKGDGEGFLGMEMSGERTEAYILQRGNKRLQRSNGSPSHRPFLPGEMENGQKHKDAKRRRCGRHWNVKPRRAWRKAGRNSNEWRARQLEGREKKRRKAQRLVQQREERNVHTHPASKDQEAAKEKNERIMKEPGHKEGGGLERERAGLAGREQHLLPRWQRRLCEGKWDC